MRTILIDLRREELRFSSRSNSRNEVSIEKKGKKKKIPKP